MEAGQLIRGAREAAGLTQSALAELAATSQSTLSAYEHGTKEPTASTMARLLAAAGMRLTSTPASRRVVSPTAGELARRGRILSQVIGLAESLPVRHQPRLRFPPLQSLVTSRP